MKRLFEVAVKLSESRGYTNDEALAYERFALFCMKKNLLGEAKAHIGRAIQLFSDWGASSRSELLKAKYDDFLVSGNKKNLPKEIDVNAEPCWFMDSGEY